MKKIKVDMLECANAFFCIMFNFKHTLNWAKFPQNLNMAGATMLDIISPGVCNKVLSEESAFAFLRYSNAAVSLDICCNRESRIYIILQTEPTEIQEKITKRGTKHAWQS